MQIDRVTRRFGAVAAVDQLSLDIGRGELFALLGASGCGKSTLLRLLAGFEQPDAGAIRLDGVDMAGTPAYARPVNMMFQSYALFPHMTVAGNIGFGLRQEGVRGTELARRVGEATALLKLDGLDRRRPHELSGGQRQRVALARALVKRPKLLLLDEPLAALDKKLREHTQFELVNIQESVGITFVVVTHDQAEAMTLASRIGVMDQGRILQVGTPTEIYESPATRFVADFIGSVNLFDGRVVDQRRGVVSVDCTALGATVRAAHTAPVAAGAPVTVAVRPEKIGIVPGTDDPAAEDDNRLAGRVDEIAYSGTHSTYLVRVGGAGMRIKVTLPNLTRGTAPITWEDEVRLAWPAESGVVLLS